MLLFQYPIYYFQFLCKTKSLYLFNCLFSTPSILQLEQEILDFAEGLRVVGVKPEEKHALFADNSCRWLVSDQGVYHL